jgi:unsaturated chondroitin disaccharide hydrolase
MPRAPSVLAATVTDEGVPERYKEHRATDQSERKARLSDAVDRIDDNIDQFYDRFRGPSSEGLVYQPTDNADGWTASFWTGQCWLAYEVTGQERFRDAAQTQLRTFDRRLDEGNVLTHDLGFLYTLSAVAGYAVTGSERYRKMAVTAADYLADRFWDAPGLIQAWGDPDRPEDDEWVHCRMIVDTMMNLPLLFWASETTGDDAYAAIAETHARTNAEHIVRPDGSTFHTFKCDTESGEPLGGETHQGYADDSCWARGQAWAIYGYALAAEYANESAYADLSTKLANYYLHRVEPDHIPRWDFDAPNDDEARDTSAAAIAACGLMQLASVLPVADGRADRYRNAALTMLDSLGEHYAADPERSNGLLTDAAYNRSEGDYNECCIWGDYFYVEGLVRATESWRRYW